MTDLINMTSRGIYKLAEFYEIKVILFNHLFLTDKTYTYYVVQLNTVSCLSSHPIPWWLPCSASIPTFADAAYK